MNNTDVILLRKLSLKSIIGFGKYSEWTVGKLIEFNKNHYLAYIYYTINGIDLLPEVLDIIKIPKKLKIDKPGENIELLKIYENTIFTKLKNKSKKRFIENQRENIYNKMQFKKEILRSHQQKR
jgi:hypothetical protein